MLRPYQVDGVSALLSAGDGQHLLCSATGTGKTVIGMEALRALGEQTLWIAHRHELIEQARRVAPPNVTLETVQTAHSRLKTLNRFPVLVIDEAHHATAATYRAVIDHVGPRILWGLTATPNRGDGVALGQVFKDIVFEYGLVQGIEDGWLSDLKVRQVRTNVDLTQVRKRAGEFVTADLSRAVNIDSRNELIADYVMKHPKPTIVFAVDVEHAKRLGEIIPRSIVVLGETPDREALLRSDWDCLINVEVCTEGFDWPNLMTGIMARPTQSPLLFQQMVGRLLRKVEGKEFAWLIDFVDNTRDHSACSAPTLLGLDPPHPSVTCSLENVSLLDIPVKMNEIEDTPEAVIVSDKVLDSWARSTSIDLMGIAWTKRPDGGLYLNLGGGNAWQIGPPSLVGKEKFQEEIKRVYNLLIAEHAMAAPIWRKAALRSWGGQTMTPAQGRFIETLDHKFYRQTFTRGQASKIIAYLQARRRQR